jgi:serine/threonine-protein kinase
MASDPPPAAKGTRGVVRIGKYEVIAHIASGGMGAVYRGRDTETGREVALKVLNPEMATKPAMVERFRREARHAAKLKHENIVQLYDFDQYQGTYYLAMEFVEGIDLYEYVRRKGPLDPEEARQIVLQGCRALRHAYDQDIVHRDVKPSNFLIARKKGRPLVKLTDLGLARETGNEEFRVTRAGTTVGTLDYMAPEQARDSGSADVRSDLYSLGTTWYHLLAGHAPFPAGGLAERLYKIMNEAPPDVRAINPRVSEHTWAVLRRLLAKDPRDRYQSPAELIDDLLSLEGRAAVRPPRERPGAAEEEETDGPHRKGRRGRRRPPSRGDADTVADAPSPEAAAPRRRGPALWLALGAVGALLVVGGVVLGLALRGRTPPPANDQTGAGAPAVAPLPGPGPVEVKPPSGEEKKDNDKDKGKKEGPTPAVVPPPRYPALTAEAVDVAALRKEAEAPWAARRPAPAAPAVLSVSRAPAGLPAPAYASLSAACAAAPAGRAVVVEVHDNGPLFDVPAAVAGRDVTVRAGKGYRPLIVWDLPRALGERTGPKGKAAEPGGLTFLSVQGGSLALEGVDLALRWPEALSQPAALLEVRGGDLTVSDCTFSVAGGNRDGVTLARFEGAKEGGEGPTRCRFTRCHARGSSLTALDLEATAGGGAEVLFEGCLVVGGAPPLLRARAAGRAACTLRAVRSTLVCGGTLLEVRATRPEERRPRLHWLGWDALLSRSGLSAGGALLALRDGVETEGLGWRAHNCLYAGWQKLQEGGTPLGGADLRDWQRQWRRSGGEGLAQAPWPQRELHEPARLPAGAFEPTGAVAFQASVDADKPLGCDLAGLPARDGWLALAYEPEAGLAEALDGAAPEVPGPGDGLYHGEALELTADVDLGARLEELQKTRKLGPRVVLRLSGKGEQTTSPIRIKGSSLVLHFAPPAPGEAPLALKLVRGGGAEALVAVEGGGLDAVGAELRVGDLSAGPQPPYVIQVKGGDVRLHRCRLEGPQRALPANYRGLIALEGPGAGGDRPRGCAITESVLVSGRAGVVLAGGDARLLLRQSLVVVGTEGLKVGLGAACKGRANVHCVLERVTFAARDAVVWLGDVPEAGPARDPVVVQARDCAFLNPFPKRQNKGCLLVYEGAALARGLLVWQSERDTFDRRLHFTPEPAGKPFPERIERPVVWVRLWGSHGVRETRPELAVLRTFGAPPWRLEHLALPPGRGADLGRLGITGKKG